MSFSSPFSTRIPDLESLREPLLSLKTHAKENFCICIPWHWIVLPSDGEEIRIENSDLSTILLLLNTMIGSGILIQPYVMRQSGIVAAFFEYVIIGSSIYIGSELLIHYGDKIKTYDFSDVVRNILGEWGSFTVDVAIVFNGFGALLSYIIIIGSLFSSIVGSDSCSQWYCSEEFLTVLPILFFTIPFCLIRRFGHLAYVAYISFFVICCVVLLVIIGGPIRKEYYEDDNHAVQTGNVGGCFRTIGDIVFALGYITVVFQTFRAHRSQDVDAYKALTLKSTAAGATLCFITGLVGYLSFVDNTQTNILFNFPGPVGDVFKMAVIIHLLLYIPGEFIIFRLSLLKLCKIDVHFQSDAQFVIVTVSSIVFVTGVSVLLINTLGDSDSLGLVVNTTGGLCGSVLYFILPGICSVKVFPEDIPRYRKGRVLFVFGVVIFLLVLVSLFV
jgi:sodium-coupled neutral amino acid transporter 11